MNQLPKDYLSSAEELEITDETSGYLIETSKWAKFIAISFYVLCGVAILLIFAFGSTLSNSFGRFGGRYQDQFAAIIFVVIIGAVIVGFTWYFLLGFANKMRSGIQSQNIEQVNAGLNAMKIHLIIIGIFLMIGIIYQLYVFSSVYA